MSVTAEDVRRRLRQARQQLSAEQVRAALRAGGQPGEATPTGPTPEEQAWSERPFSERVTQVGAAALEPTVRLVEGFSELTGAPPETVAAATRGREALGREAAKAPPQAQFGGRVAGETALLLAPGSVGARTGQALRAVPGFRSGLTRATAPLAGETAAIAGVEALKTPREGQTRGEAAMGAATGQVIGAGLQRAVRGALMPGAFRRTPVAEDEARALRAAGIEPRIPLSAKGVEGTGPFSKFASWMHRRPLGSVPPTQSIIKGQQEAALSDWRDMMFRQAVPEGADIQVPGAREGSLKPVRDTFGDIDDWYSNEYKQVLDPYTFDVQGERGLVGAAIDQAVEDIPGEASRRVVQNKIGELLADMSDSGGRLTGGKVSQFKKILRKQASRVDVDPEVATGYRDVIDALDDSVEQSIRQVNPGHADRLAALRQPYRNFVVLEDAAKGRIGGEFDPDDLLRASERKVTQEKRPSARAAGRGPLQWEAERAAQTYDFPTGGEESNIFQLQALAGGTAALAPSFLGPAGVAVTGALATPTTLGLTRGGTRFLSNEAKWQRYLQDLLQREGFQELSRAARTGGAQYATE